MQASMPLTKQIRTLSDFKDKIAVELEVFSMHATRIKDMIDSFVDSTDIKVKSRADFNFGLEHYFSTISAL